MQLKCDKDTAKVKLAQERRLQLKEMEIQEQEQEMCNKQWEEDRKVRETRLAYVHLKFEDWDKLQDFQGCLIYLGILLPGLNCIFLQRATF